MRYLRESVGSVLPPKIMGTYELELHSRIESLKRLAPRNPIVVGAAEGYYAVGLAMFSSVSRLIAFEAVEKAHGLIRDLARLNGVESKLDIRGLYDCSLLKAALAECDDARPVLIVDIEGAEAILLDTEAVPPLRQAYLLVEMHEAFVPGLAERMKERFSATHQIEIIPSHDRVLSDLPPALLPLPPFTQSAALYALREWRGVAMNWWWMQPRD
jgi:hypothetical protein